MSRYEDPRSIFSEENRKRAGTRTPKEVLDAIRKKKKLEFSDLDSMIDNLKVEIHGRFRHLLNSLAALEARLCELEAACGIEYKGKETLVDDALYYPIEDRKNCIKWVKDMADEFLKHYIHTASVAAFIMWITERENGLEV